MRLYPGFKFINKWERASASCGLFASRRSWAALRWLQVKGKESSCAGKTSCIYSTSFHPSSLPSRGQQPGEVRDTAGAREPLQFPSPSPTGASGLFRERRRAPHSWPGQLSLLVRRAVLWFEQPGCASLAVSLARCWPRRAGRWVA